MANGTLRILAQMSRTALCAKISPLEEALTRRFNGHHAFPLAKMLARVDRPTGLIPDIDERIDEQIAPFVDAVTRRSEIPGVRFFAARVLIAEIGVDMSRFRLLVILPSGLVRTGDQ